MQQKLPGTRFNEFAVAFLPSIAPMYMTLASQSESFIYPVKTPLNLPRF
jgi:hypothetical protein